MSAGNINAHVLLSTVNNMFDTSRVVNGTEVKLTSDSLRHNHVRRVEKKQYRQKTTYDSHATDCSITEGGGVCEKHCSRG